MSEKIIEIARIVMMSLSVIMLVVSVILSILAKSKNKKVSNAATNLLMMTEECRKLMNLAEGITGFGGATKKEWVLIKLNDFAIKNNINYDEEEMSKVVEKFMELANSINAKVEESQVIESKSSDSTAFNPLKS